MHCQIQKKNIEDLCDPIYNPINNGDIKQCLGFSKLSEFF